MYEYRITIPEDGIEWRDSYEMHRTVYSGFPVRLTERVLYRAESSCVLVRSQVRQTWQLPAQRCDPLQISAGKRYVFNLIANPTTKRYGKRHSLKTQDELRWWIESRLQQSGLHVARVSYRKIDWSSRARKDIKLDVVEYSGVATVENVGKAEIAYWAGIGPAKGFGCGLLKLQEMQ